MKCSDVLDRLSAYYDGELSDDSQASIARHLAECDACTAELAAFEHVTRAVSRMPQPDVPPTIWSSLVAKLALGDSTTSSACPQPTRTRNGQSQRWWSSHRRLALAASILVMLGIGYWIARDMGYSREGSHEHGAEFVATMDHYLHKFPNDPEAARRFLLNKYDGQTVSADDAVKLVGYRPAVADGLPEGYTLASTSVLKMPCCTCVKAVCKRQDGSTLVLFEHDDEETEWFGDRPSNMAICGDKECSLVRLEPGIAATWKRGSRSVTAVGVRDVDEVNTLVRWLDKT